MIQRSDPTVPDDNFSPSGKDRLDQLDDVVRLVLVVGVGIHDHVGPRPDCGVESRTESGREPAIALELDHVLHA